MSAAYVIQLTAWRQASATLMLGQSTCDLIDRSLNLSRDIIRLQIGGKGCFIIASEQQPDMVGLMQML